MMKAVFVSRTGYTGEDGFEIICGEDVGSENLGIAHCQSRTSWVACRGTWRA